MCSVKSGHNRINQLLVTSYWGYSLSGSGQLRKEPQRHGVGRVQHLDRGFHQIPSKSGRSRHVRGPLLTPKHVQGVKSGLRPAFFMRYESVAEYPCSLLCSARADAAVRTSIRKIPIFEEFTTC